MKDIKLILAKQYINNFYNQLILTVDKKELKAIRKSVEKYEDVSYLKNLLNDEIKENLKKQFNNDVSKEQNAIKHLDDFYNTYFLNKEIIDVPAIKKELDIVEKDLLTLNDQTYIREINQLYDFKNNINVELSVYISKHKSEEYMDMSVFHRNITGYINEIKALINDIIKDKHVDSNEYLVSYIEFVYRQYSLIFENSANKTSSMPQWAKGLLFCAPWIVGFALFTIYPLIQTLIFSFSNVTLSTSGFETTPVGFKNYINVFTNDTDFILALKNYLVEMVVYVPLITIFSLSIALLLNTKIKTKGFFRTVFFFPVIITSGPVIKILIEQGVTAMPGMKTLFDMNTITNGMPELVRIAFNILTSEFTMILWFSGIQILVFVTALQKIDKGVYEASAIDGANRWEQFWKVTLPAVNPTIVINVVFTVVMQSIFALNPIILKIQNDMNDTAEGKGYGYSSALAFTYFIIMIAVLVIFVLIFKKHERKNRRA